jgi:predicted RNA binding protein YcfA (HicA-like mRNA interferase family)
MEWSSEDTAKVIESLTFSLARRESHDTYTKVGHPRTVSIPRNRKALSVGVVSSIWRQAGITAALARQIREGKKP